MKKHTIGALWAALPMNSNSLLTDSIVFGDNTCGGSSR
jgi:hypothetical protein